MRSAATTAPTVRRSRRCRGCSQRFAAPAEVTAAGVGAGSIEALTVALDFRSDRLVVFSRQGSLLARELPGKGAPHALQRLGPSPPAGAHVAAVLSDDDRAIGPPRGVAEPLRAVERDRRGLRMLVRLKRPQ